MFTYHSGTMTYRNPRPPTGDGMPDTETQEIQIAIVGCRLRRPGHGDPPCAGTGSRTSSCSSGPTTSAAPGATTPIPGCACDVPVALYSFSFAPNPDWTPRLRPPARDPGLPARRAPPASASRAHIRFGHEVLEADWDEDADRWQLDTSGGDFTARRPHLAPSAPWRDPSIPALPGLDRFEGTVFHSARWNHDHDLTGRRSRSSAPAPRRSSSCPRSSPRCGRLDLFQRTPPWVLPRGNPVIPAR